MFTTRLTLAAALVAGLSFAGSASAQVRSWNFGDGTAPGACTITAGSGNTMSCSEQPNGTTTTLTAQSFSVGSTVGSTYAAATTTYQGTGSGVGITHTGESTTSPEHAGDNIGNVDLLQINFTSSQILKSVTIGWSGTDGDYQVLRWAGAGAAAAVAGKTTAQLISAGWALVNTVDGAGNISSPDITTNINSGNLSSSSWLITAYNSAFGGSLSTGNDAIKILGVSTGIPVSAPGTLALSALALAGLAVVRRRNAS
jgi:MYXO-CTERM domain-containing protein